MWVRAAASAHTHREPSPDKLCLHQLTLLISLLIPFLWLKGKTCPSLNMLGLIEVLFCRFLSFNSSSPLLGHQEQIPDPLRRRWSIKAPTAEPGGRRDLAAAGLLAPHISVNLHTGNIQNPGNKAVCLKVERCYSLTLHSFDLRVLLRGHDHVIDFVLTRLW